MTRTKPTHKAKRRIYKTACLLTALLLPLALLGGCATSSKEYSEVASVFKGVLDLKSGNVLITSTSQNEINSKGVKSEFSFLSKENGEFTFCHLQYDNAKKPIYCDYSDEAEALQWFIGKGWSKATKLSYTKENPHRYIKLLSTPPRKEAVSSIEVNALSDKTQYIITLDPQKLNELEYKEGDLAVISQKLTLTADKEGRLCEYKDSCVMLDKKTNEETTYVADAAISQQDALSEITKPELREYGLQAAAEVEEK